MEALITITLTTEKKKKAAYKDKQCIHVLQSVPQNEMEWIKENQRQHLV